MSAPDPVLLDAANFTTLQITETSDRLHAQLNRPEVRNAIDATMITELHAVCAHLEHHPKLLILSGTESGGKGIFASGADIGQLRERRRADALRGVNSTAFERLAKLPMPVIAALDGYALGGGAELAWAADFRLGTPEVKIGQPETGLGIIPAAGALWRLRELAGEGIAKEILLAGRILDAQESLTHGLLNAIHPADGLLDAAHALADRIAKQDPLAVRISKQVFSMPREAHPQIDNLAQAILFESEAKFERMQAFLDRREAKAAAKPEPTSGENR
ncbi:enoyl-CoA hydratase/isomerase family protein [Nesterenkonia sp. E16_7]|uniref:enoyl-CoA hydratase/isomerase family protein n=1 Tax=unclassified Nesterenkonia TaxID=2629769 RepID=UPI001A90E596|nr:MULTISPECIES: enoyl-CoA hydratase/isomerase family protein [unclassified Nesterenkonia]MBO0596843.1 enoyl-CoA hydratase/isomerase family protein [Nesterenkonia sp. E16_10]MBO0598205.1 enoyl-CoA hydratase/isomerase family protein [Nesterenkonia sp. E16_7]